jgi:hypothetical protein
MITPVAVANSTPPAQTVKIGQYVQFGTYNATPITWRIIHMDANGNPLLFSEQILTFKSFDAAGSKYTDPVRKKYGSNQYEQSTLRRWLNASERTITWKNNPPVDGNLMDGKGGYAEEAGFLASNNFTAPEKSLIVPSKNKVILHHSDQSLKQGGTSSLLFDANITKSMQNIGKNAFYHFVTDQVFLLSIEQLHQYVFSRGYDIRAKPSARAVSTSPESYPGMSAKNYWHYWLNTPNGQHAGSTRFVFFDGMLNKYFSHSEVIGVRPATFLDIRKAIFSTGSGTVNNPFRVARTAINPANPVAKNTVLISGNQLFVNNKKVTLSQNAMPTKIKGQMMVPARALLQALGLSVSWDASTNSMKAVKKGYSIRLSPGKSTALINNITTKTMAVPVTDIRGTLMVHAQFVTRELNDILTVK